MPSAKEPTVLVRYGKLNRIGHFTHHETRLPAVMSRVVVQTERGLEIGEIISPAAAHDHHTCVLAADRIDRYAQATDPRCSVSREGHVVRLASGDDLREARHLEALGRRDRVTCRRWVEQLGLPMKIVDVERLFGGRRLIVYFKAPQRVDFRELAQRLRQEFQTRVELRQIGARHEAKLLGDCDTCGRELCCKRFLQVLQPVNVKMAKRQGLPMASDKLTGVCGRLKCCIRYEDVTYAELQARLPKIGQSVQTAQGPAVVLDAQVHTQLVKLRLTRTGEVLALNVEELVSTEPMETLPEGAETPSREHEAVGRDPQPSPPSAASRRRRRSGGRFRRRRPSAQ